MHCIENPLLSDVVSSQEANAVASESSQRVVHIPAEGFLLSNAVSSSHLKEIGHIFAIRIITSLLLDYDFHLNNLLHTSAVRAAPSLVIIIR